MDIEEGAIHNSEEEGSKEELMPIYEKDKNGEEIIADFEDKMDQLEKSAMENIPLQVGEFDYHDENSPLTMSPDNSDDENDSQFRQLNFQEIEENVQKYYQQHDPIYSNELDALITFIKGQKHLYMHAKHDSERRLHILILPAIIISAFIAVFSSFIDTYEWSNGFISGLNGVVAILVAVVNYFKLESNAHSYYLTAFQFDKLETSLEFIASKVGFLKDEKEKEVIILEKIQESEQKINEIKEWNHLFVPNDVRKRFPNICHLNIFSFIKRMESNRRNILYKFQHVKNEIRYIAFQFEKHQKSLTSQEKFRMERRMQIVINMKEQMKKDLFCFRNAYSYLDELFNVEISNAEQYSWWQCWSGVKKQIQVNSSNHIVDQYIQHSH